MWTLLLHVGTKVNTRQKIYHAARNRSSMHMGKLVLNMQLRDGQMSALWRLAGLHVWTFKAPNEICKNIQD